MIVKTVLSPGPLRGLIITSDNEVTTMQANRHSTYHSSYNTQTIATQQKVEIVKGKPMLTTVAVTPSDTNLVTTGTHNAPSRAFDFAGLAG